MLNMFKLGIPIGKREIDAVETFEVRWNSFHRSYSFANVKAEAQFFTSKEEADAFKEALENANSLLRNNGYKSGLN